MPALAPLATLERASYCAGSRNRVYGSFRVASIERMALYASCWLPSLSARLFTAISFCFFHPSSPIPLKVPSTYCRFTSRQTSTASCCSSFSASASERRTESDGSALQGSLVAANVRPGKAEHDKRNTIKDRDWEREKGRLMRHKVSSTGNKD